MPAAHVQQATRDSIWFVPFGTTTLQSAFDPSGTTDPVAVQAQQFTVSLETVQFAKGPEHGWLGLLHRSRDLLIASTTAMGTEPQVQRVHY